MKDILINIITVHPGWSLLVIFVLSYCVIEGIFSIINRIIRHSNIATKGWPPEHLDADGDWKEESDE